MHVITLTLGANDIFPVLEGPICRTGPADPVCKAALDDATGQIESGVRTVLERLRDAAGPETLILVATYYDPFDFGLGLAFERLSDETIRTLNDNILAAARTNDVAVADTHGLFRGTRGGAYPRIGRRRSSGRCRIRSPDARLSECLRGRRAV